MISARTSHYDRRGRLIVAGAIASVVLVCLIRIPWGCGKPARITAPEPTASKTVPNVRVLVTARPVETITLSTTAGYHLGVDEHIISRSQVPLAEVAVVRSGRDWQLGKLNLQGSRVVLTAVPGGCISAGGVSYRGELRLMPVGDGGFSVVNHLDMPSYLAGVLARELYPNWSLETFRAQAIAARSFAIYHMLTFGKSHDYDLGSTQASQVYGGFAAETPKAWQAITSTSGQVLAYGKEGQEQILMSQYSACCGGWVNSADVIRPAQNIPPFQGGQQCRDCAECPRYRWPVVSVRKSDLLGALSVNYQEARKLTEIAELRVVEQNAHGRPVWVDVVAPDAQFVRLRAEDIRISLLRADVEGASKLHSMNCTIRNVGEFIEFADGRGFGHGVGMCQWGAQHKAAAGVSCHDILAFYYPGAKIFRAY